MRFRVCKLPGSLLIWLSVSGGGVASGSELEAIQVRADELRSQTWQSSGNRSTIEPAEIKRVGQEHAAELFQRLPGVWISRGDGQEHLTAIRSPVLTGPGACGAFLFLENGIPIRPAGFCNVNDLLEINHEQAGDIEVIRGPASALYGGNALHGVINVRTAKPAIGSFAQLGMDIGQDDFSRLRYTSNRGDAQSAWRLDYQAGHSNGWRDDAGYEQQKLNLQQRLVADDWQVESHLAGTWLQQETAGFIFGKDAYRAAGGRRDNPNPEAYRNAWSLRGSVEIGRPWIGEDGDQGWLSLTPYLRSSKMDFLQHFLAGQPGEKNGQQSAGILFTLSSGSETANPWTISSQVEYADGFLQEHQEGPVMGGSPFLIATRPAGTHYDYLVKSMMAATHFDQNWRLAERLIAVTSARLETLGYDYDNRFLTGNSKPDGSACPFGGCLFNRPADRSDRFNNLGARAGLQYETEGELDLYLTAGRGFRPPQATELYRLQNSQAVADLDSENILSLEFGGRDQIGPWQYQTTLFWMDKTDVILRDAEGFNISNGKTRHWGLELDLDWQIDKKNGFNLAFTHARHTYRFNADATLGEIIRSGNEIDTAPRHFGRLGWLHQSSQSYWWELEAIYMGSYQLDAANEHQYGGHRLLNLRAGMDLGAGLQLRVGLTNLTNSNYAERADFAFGRYRYFPGRSRQLLLSLDAAFL